jgi:hypothetical protein
VLVATPPTSSASPSGSLLGAPPSGLSKGGGLGWVGWWWGPTEHHCSDSDPYPCHCSWRCALAILSQPMVRAHLDVAPSGQGEGPHPQLQLVAIFISAASTLAPAWSLPAQPSQPPPGLGWIRLPWRSPSAPSANTEWIADLGDLLPYHSRC